MPFVVGVAKSGYILPDSDLFVVISDTKTTEFMLPLDTDEEYAKDLLRALGSRIAASDTKDLEEFVEGLVYNFPAEIYISEPYGTYEEALKNAQDYMELVNDFEEKKSILREAIMVTEGLEEE